MAFVGRMNSRGNLVMDSDTQTDTRHTKCSRTYIKSYDSEPRGLVSRPSLSTARYVGHSASSYELNSADDTEMSTLRYSSPRSFETETVTLTPKSRIGDSSLSGDSGGDAGTDEQAFLMQDNAENQPQERGSTTSMCSWEEEEIVSSYVSGDQLTYSCSIPLLDLSSNTGSLQYDPQMQLDQLKIVRRSDEAYNNWLSGKKRLGLYKRQAMQEERELKRQQDELRKQLNEKRVQEWCQRKASQYANKRKSNPATSQVQVAQVAHVAQVAQRRLQNWELQKVEQAERQRQRQQREALRKQRELQQRKQQAAAAWQQWIKGAAHRPKPVPLNQGLNTLRGTVSNIYVNPNSWVHVNEKN
ncbi:coiled-coil domain-containing protein 34 [Drosophila hydei]|uniref:Coiled-coil domain-containing protein 34 n=1 Tax=Drosophila hydei TaxID=7224 RepID=A0A6J1MDF1_DROHY|nr:coiled-coil domain-containing protein 34 [Drosophila hydei]